MTGWATYRALGFLKEHWGCFDGWVGLLGIGWGHWMSILIRHMYCFIVQKWGRLCTWIFILCNFLGKSFAILAVSPYLCRPKVNS